MSAETKAAPLVVSLRAAARGQMEANVREWIRAHVATVSEEGNHIRFAKPGTSTYSINFRIEGGFLLVWGDVGDAIYQWGDRLTWEFLRGCGFDYFAGKCQAHPRGRRARGWDSDVARDDIRHYAGRLDGDAWERVDEALCDRGEWEAFLYREGYDVLGDDWTDWAGSVGGIPDLTTLAHWVMLRAAVGKVLGGGR